MIQTIKVNQIPRQKVCIGHVGENEFRQVIFDVSEWKTAFQDGNAVLVFVRPDGYVYPIILSVNDDGNPVFIPTSTETAVAGIGEMQLRWMQGEAVGKTCRISITVHDSVENEGSIPDDPEEDWISRIIDVINEASPRVTVDDIDGGHRVTISDATGDHIFDVMNGTDGDDGDDGVSPVVSVTEIDGGHRVTITDVSGAHTFDVLDGDSGAQPAPFVIPITESGGTYSTTASAADILANIDNCVIVFGESDESVIIPSNYVRSESISVIMAELTQSVYGYIQNTTLQISVQNDTVHIQYFTADSRPERPFAIHVTETVTEDGSTYSTTATASDILDNIDNCVVDLGGTVITKIMHQIIGSYATALFGGSDSVNGYVQNVSVIVTIYGSDVDVAYYSSDARPELPPVTYLDDGKSLVVEYGAWVAARNATATPRVVKNTSDTTAMLDPNKLYVFPEMSALTIMLYTPSDSDIVNEYHFMFDSGATPTILRVPASIMQPDAFSVDANMRYEISILDGCMAAQGWPLGSGGGT